MALVWLFVAMTRTEPGGARVAAIYDERWSSSAMRVYAGPTRAYCGVMGWRYEGRAVMDLSASQMDETCSLARRVSNWSLDMFRDGSM